MIRARKITRKTTHPRFLSLIPVIPIYLAVFAFLMMPMLTGNLTGCTARDASPPDAPEIPGPVEEVYREESEVQNPADAWVAERLKDMSLEEKAGQVLMLAFRRNASGEPLLAVDEGVIQRMTQLQPGGIILFAENVEHEDQVKNLIREFQSNASIPLFMAVDEEGGRVSRLTGGRMDFPRVPAARSIGRAGDEAAAEAVGHTLGKALKELGFNMNMAPVADVDSNPRNPVIGDRSYGSDPALVAAMAGAVARGMKAEGVIPVYKHFPGHGDTDQDTHTGPVTLSHDRERLHQVELVPFVRGIETGMPAMMTAHLLVPAYDEQLPATLSPVLLTELLRETLSFHGLVITDALEMAAISDKWSSGEAAVKALAAGADVLLMPQDAVEAHEAIVTAVEKGRLPMERLDQAVESVLKLKARFELVTPVWQTE